MNFGQGAHTFVVSLTVLPAPLVAPLTCIDHQPLQVSRNIPFAAYSVRDARERAA